MSPAEVIGWGCLGGVIPDVLRVLPYRYKEVPAYLGRPFFWVSIIILIVIGGAMAYLLAPSSAVNAVAVGYSAPSILSKLLGEKEPNDVEVTRGPLHTESKNPLDALRKWWSL